MRWPWKKILGVCLAVWAAIGSVGTFFDLWAIISFGAKRVGTMTSIGGTVLPPVITFAIIVVAGTASSMLGLWLVYWVKYRWNDGPKVERLRTLAPKLGTVKAWMIRHYRNRESSLEGDVLADASALMVEFSELADLLRELGVPVKEATPFVGDDDRRMRFTLAYLSALERRARQGDLQGARSPYLVNHC